MKILLAVYEGISERIVGRTHALQNNRQFWFKITVSDISAFWRPELGGNADPDVQGNLVNAPDTAQTGQNGGAAGEEPSSQLVECDPASANLSGQTQSPMISGSLTAAG